MQTRLHSTLVRLCFVISAIMRTWKEFELTRSYNYNGPKKETEYKIPRLNGQIINNLMAFYKPCMLLKTCPSMKRFLESKVFSFFIFPLLHLAAGSNGHFLSPLSMSFPSSHQLPHIFLHSTLGLFLMGFYFARASINCLGFLSSPVMTTCPSLELLHRSDIASAISIADWWYLKVAYHLVPPFFGINLIAWNLFLFCSNSVDLSTVGNKYCLNYILLGFFRDFSVSHDGYG